MCLQHPSKLFMIHLQDLIDHIVDLLKELNSDQSSPQFPNIFPVFRDCRRCMINEILNRAKTHVLNVEKTNDHSFYDSE